MKKVQFIDSIRDRLIKKRSGSDRYTTFKIYSLKYIPIIFSFLLLNFFLALVLSVIWWLLVTIFYDHRDIQLFSPTIRIWFGVPGSGKTSVAAWIARESIRHHYKVLSNVEIQGTYKLDPMDLGTYDMSFDGEGCHVIFDEATVNGLDNRAFKEFSKTNKPLYFSLHRHMNNRVDVFSQDYDVDLKVKGRAGSKGLFHLSRLPIPGFVYYRRIKKVFFIKKEDKQFLDGFEYAGLPRICYVRSVWKSFDTLDMSMCPKQKKPWIKWEDLPSDDVEY